MPLVHHELKERIKREVSIQRLAEARGIKLRRSGKELIGLCPFHKDRNPSLNIGPVKNVWHCKGAGGEARRDRVGEAGRGHQLQSYLEPTSLRPKRTSCLGTCGVRSSEDIRPGQPRTIRMR